MTINRVAALTKEDNDIYLKLAWRHTRADGARHSKRLRRRSVRWRKVP